MKKMRVCVYFVYFWYLLTFVASWYCSAPGVELLTSEL